MAGIVDHGVRNRIRALEERAMRRDREIAELSARFLPLGTKVNPIEDSGSSTMPPPIPPRALSSPVPPDPPISSTPANPSRLPSPSQPPPPAAAAVELPPAPIGFASLIVTVFPGLFDPPIKKSFFSRTTPALFAEFRGKRFTLLWRGSRDGFLAQNFHDRCDGHANTLTFIEDTEGNIFGGFTPVEWESSGWRFKGRLP
jgi:hypothetical protein